MRRAPSPMRRAPSPMRRAPSPMRRAPSAMRRALSAMRRALSPMRRALSPMRRAPSAMRRALSAMRRALSAMRRALSPMRRALSPMRRAKSLAHRVLSSEFQEKRLGGSVSYFVLDAQRGRLALHCHPDRGGGVPRIDRSPPDGGRTGHRLPLLHRSEMNRAASHRCCARPCGLDASDWLQCTVSFGLHSDKNYFTPRS